MKTFTTESGYIFKLFHPGDICSIQSTEGFKVSKFSPGTVVKVMSSPEVFGREVKVLNETTGETDSVCCDFMDLVEGTVSDEEELEDDEIWGGEDDGW